MEPTIIRYEVTNRITGKVSQYRTRAAATKAADRADNAYGSYICTTRAIWSDQVAA